MAKSEQILKWILLSWVYISDHISNFASFALDIIISDSGELLKEFYLSEATGDFKGWAFPISLWTKGNQRLRLPQTT